MDDRPRLAGYLLGTWTWLLLGWIIPLAVLSAGSFSTASAITAITANWSALRLSQLIAHGKPLLFDFTFWLYVYVFLGISATAQITLGVFPETLPGVRSEFVEPAAMVCLVGIASWESGRFLAERRSGTMPRTRNISGTRAKQLLAVGLVCATYYVYKIGVTSLITSREAVSQAKTDAWPSPTLAVVVGAAAMAPLLIGTHGLIQHRQRLKAAGHRPGVSVLLIVSLAMLILTTNPIASPRILAGTVLMSFLPLLGLLATPARVRAAMLTVIGLLMVVFPYADYYRTDHGSLRLRSPLTLFATKGDYDSFPMIVNTVEYIHRFGHTDGMQAVGSALFWLPRTVWLAKPRDTGILVTSTKGAGFTNVAAPLWAEAFVDGGWLLLVAAFVALGWFMRRGSQRGLRDLSTHGVGAVSSAVLSFYMLMILRGSLLQAMCTFSALMTCLWFIRARSPDPAAPVQGRPEAPAAARSATTSR